MRTKIIRSLLAFCITVGVVNISNAQSSKRLDAPGWSVGMTLGMSDLWGDVGTESIMDHYINPSYYSSIHLMGGVYGRYSFHPAFAMRIGVNYGVLYATDKWNYPKAVTASDGQSDYVQRYFRNQDIKDYMWEGNLLLEFMPLRLDPESKIARRSGQPVILAGIGYFHFQPYSSLNGDWHKIYNLHLEGDGWNIPGAPARYTLTQLCIPVGFGYRFDVGKKLNVGLEYLYHICFTDYLDGVSAKYIDPSNFDSHLSPEDAALAKQLADKTKYVSTATNSPGFLRGTASNNDSYSTVSLTFFYKIKSHRIPWWE